jgi:hypothetical protein
MNQSPKNRFSFSPEDDRLQHQAGNKKLVERILHECGLRPDGFITNEDLELYYDIARGQHALGCISKGWEDPGFRVGDVVRVPFGRLEALKDKLPGLMKYCATRGIAMTGEALTRDIYEFHLDSVIYSEGFNQKVFAQVLQSLTDCVGQFRATFAVA